MQRAHGTVAAISVIGAICLACTGSTTVYTRRQVGVTMPPGGPHATGAILPDGKTSIEVAAEATYGAPATAPRSSTVLGQAIAPISGRLRFAHGLFDRIEIGMDLEAAPGAIARTTATDISPQSHDGWLVRGGFQVRAIVVGSRRFGLGLSAEASVGNAPYTATWGTGSTYPEQTVLFMPFANAGLFLHGMPTRSFALLGGVLVQATPRFDGAQTWTVTCAPSSCTSVPDPIPSRFTLRPVGTLWLGTSYTFGDVTLVAQFFANVLADPQMTALAPFGGTLGVRYAF